MKSLKFKDIKRRRRVSAMELDSTLSRFITASRILPSYLKVRAQNKLNRNRFNSLTRIVNRCILTGRSRGVYSSLKISRIMLRELANKGNLSGIRKSSW